MCVCVESGQATGKRHRVDLWAISRFALVPLVLNSAIRFSRFVDLVNDC